jgi:hypothetical protein
MDENPLLQEHETEAIVPCRELLQNQIALFESRTRPLASDCTVPLDLLDRSGLFWASPNKIDNSASNCAWPATGTPSINTQQKQSWYHQQSLFCSPSRIIVLSTWLTHHEKTWNIQSFVKDKYWTNNKQIQLRYQRHKTLDDRTWMYSSRTKTTETKQCSRLHKMFRAPSTQTYPLIWWTAASTCLKRAFSMHLVQGLINLSLYCSNQLSLLDQQLNFLLHNRSAVQG